MRGENGRFQGAATPVWQVPHQVDATLFLPGRLRPGRRRIAQPMIPHRFSQFSLASGKLGLGSLTKKCQVS